MKKAINNGYLASNEFVVFRTNIEMDLRRTVASTTAGGRLEWKFSGFSFGDLEYF